MWDFGTVKKGTVKNQNFDASTFTRRQAVANAANQYADDDDDDSYEGRFNSPNNGQFHTPDTTPQKQPPPRAARSRFDTGGSGGSSGGSNGGTIRQGGAGGASRPGLSGMQAGANNGSPSKLAMGRQDPSVHQVGPAGGDPVAARDYGGKFNTNTSSGSGSLGARHGRFASAAEAYDAAANGGGSSESRRFASEATSADEVEMERRRMESMRMGRDNEEEPGALSGPPQEELTALDTVLLPVLEQLSMAVSHDPNAQRTISNLCAAFAEAERTTRGFSNAFSIEVFHAMSAPDGDGEGEEGEEEED